jgi:hypothetical protein
MRQSLMSDSENHKNADAAFKALFDLFSLPIQTGKSRYAGTRYIPTMQNGEVIFVPDPDDIAFNKAFDETLDVVLETKKIRKTRSN